jgi:hypothetical protein
MATAGPYRVHVLVGHGAIGPLDELAPFLLVFATAAGVTVRPLIARLQALLSRRPRWR